MQLAAAAEPLEASSPTDLAGDKETRAGPPASAAGSARDGKAPQKRKQPNEGKAAEKKRKQQLGRAGPAAGEGRSAQATASAEVAPEAAAPAIVVPARAALARAVPVRVALAGAAPVRRAPAAAAPAVVAPAVALQPRAVGPAALDSDSGNDSSASSASSEGSDEAQIRVDVSTLAHVKRATPGCAPARIQPALCALTSQQGRRANVQVAAARELLTHVHVYTLQPLCHLLLLAHCRLAVTFNCTSGAEWTQRVQRQLTALARERGQCRRQARRVLQCRGRAHLGSAA